MSHIKDNIIGTSVCVLFLGMLVGGSFMIAIGKQKMDVPLKNRADVEISSNVIEDDDKCMYSYLWMNKTTWCFYDRSSRCVIYDRKGVCMVFSHFCKEPSYRIVFDPNDPIRTKCEVESAPLRVRVMFGFGIAMVIIGGLVVLPLGIASIVSVYSWCRNQRLRPLATQDPMPKNILTLN